MENNTPQSDKVIYYPGKACIWGMGAGIPVVLLGWPVLGAAVATGVAAFQKGATPGRVIGLTLLSLLGAFLLSLVPGYFLLFDIFFGADLSPGADPAEVIRQGQMVVGLFLAPLGALFGMMFGGRRY